MKEHSGKYNLIMVYILQASGFLFPMITYPYITRTLGSAGLGTVGFANSVSNFFAAVATFGLSSYAVRCCARLRTDKAALRQTAGELLTANGATTLLAAALYAAAILAVPRFRVEWPYMLLFGVAFASEFLGMSWLYTALERFDYITVRTIAFKCLSLALIFLCVRRGSDALLYAGILALSAVGTNLLNFFYARRLLSRPVRLTRGFSRHYAFTKWFFLQSVSLTVFSNMDVTMLGFVSSATQIGNYEVALKLKLLLSTLVSSLGSVFLPRLSLQYKERDMAAYWGTANKSLRYACFLSLPILGFLCVGSDDIILLFCGEGYAYAGTILAVLGAAIPFIGVSTVTGVQLLLSMEKEKHMLLSLAAGCALNLLMNLWLIPRYQGRGAAVATVCAECLVMTLQLLFLRSMHIRLPLLSLVKKPLGGATAACGCALLLRRALPLPLFWRLAVSGLAFAGVYAGILWIWGEPILREIVRLARRKESHE